MLRALKLTAQALAALAVIGLLALLIRNVSRQNGGISSKLKSGHAVSAPDFTLDRLGADGRVSLAAYKGRPVVVNFFASWCIPCAKEAKALERAWQQWKPEGVVVIGVDWQDFAGDARHFVKKHGITYPVGRTNSGHLVNAYGVQAVPETFFVNRKGVVVGYVPAPITDDDLAAGIQKALAE